MNTIYDLVDGAEGRLEHINSRIAEMEKNAHQEMNLKVNIIVNHLLDKTEVTVIPCNDEPPSLKFDNDFDLPMEAICKGVQKHLRTRIKKQKKRRNF